MRYENVVQGFQSGNSRHSIWKHVLEIGSFPGYRQIVEHGKFVQFIECETLERFRLSRRQSNPSYPLLPYLQWDCLSASARLSWRKCLAVDPVDIREVQRLWFHCQQHSNILEFQFFPISKFHWNRRFYCRSGPTIWGNEKKKLRWTILPQGYFRQTYCKFLKTLFRSGSMRCTISFPCRDKLSIKGHSSAKYKTSFQDFILQFARWRFFRNIKTDCSSNISSFVGCLMRFLLRLIQIN